MASLQPDPASLASLRVSVMARTKERRNLSSQEQAASSERAARRCAGILKAARMLPSQEVAHWAHMHVENCTPEPAQVVKLSAVTTGGGGRVEWRGRLRTGGSDVILEGTWVRQNFKAYVKLHSALRLLTPCVCSLRSAFRLVASPDTTSHLCRPRVLFRGHVESFVSGARRG